METFAKKLKWLPPSNVVRYSLYGVLLRDIKVLRFHGFLDDANLLVVDSVSSFFLKGNLLLRW